MEINLMAPINPLGYGVAGSNILRALHSRGNDVSLFPIGPIQPTDERLQGPLSDGIQKATFFNKDAPSVKIWHQHAMAERIGCGLNCGFPIFELDSFSDVEKHQLNSLDRIFVCSKWAKEVVKSETNISDVRVIPLGVDTEIFKPLENTERSSATIFLNIGKWEFRKGHDLIPEIFSQAFSIEDDVALIMMCDNPFLDTQQHKEWVDAYANSPMGEKIQFYHRAPNQADVCNVMNHVDCGIFPVRAEGWNLELLEMMACGKKVITTDYSGHTEFCNEENSLLVPIEEMEPAYDGIWFHGDGGQWASISENAVELMAEHMRDVHQSKQDGEDAINKEGLLTADKFSWDNSAKELEKAII